MGLEKAGFTLAAVGELCGDSHRFVQNEELSKDTTVVEQVQASRGVAAESPTLSAQESCPRFPSCQSASPSWYLCTLKVTSTEVLQSC